LDDKGGFILAHWDGTAETEEKIKEETKATIRCIPLEGNKEEGKCILTGNLRHNEWYLRGILKTRAWVRSKLQHTS